MGVNFTPSFGTYSPLTPFRFWCQKVLPLTYDDSLSYYELLNKVVDYLNKTMEDVETLHDDTDAMLAAFNALQTYVNTYFDELDLTAEVQTVLDRMAENGSLDELLRPIVGEQIGDVVAEQIDDVVASQIYNTVAEQINTAIIDVLNGSTVMQNSVEGWLNEHIPTGEVVVDNTLSITGAAADSAKVGDVVAKHFSITENYTAGDYVLYNGELYRFIANHTAGAWTATETVPANDATQVNIGNEIEKVRNELLVAGTPSTTKFNVSPGAISGTGADNNQATWIPRRRRTGYATFKPGDIISCDPAYSMVVYYYSSNSASAFLEVGSYIGYRYELPEVENATIIRIMIKRADEENFGDDELPTITYTPTTSTIQTLRADLTTLSNATMQLRTYSTPYDLNDFTDIGYAIIGYSDSCANAPSENTGYRSVFTIKSGSVIWQFYINRTGLPTDTIREFYIRVYAGGSWKGWIDFSPTDVEAIESEIGALQTALNGLDTAAMQLREYTEPYDLDTFTDVGYTIIGYGKDCANAPSVNKKYRSVFTIVYGGVKWQIYINHSYGELYTRVYASGAWGSWASLIPDIPEKYNESQNYSIYDPDYTQSSVTGDISLADTVRVMSYNVAQYDNDGTVHIGDESKKSTLVHFKEMLMHVNADIICTQEDAEYMDSDNTLAPLPCIFAPLYTHKSGVGGPAIYYRSGSIANFPSDVNNIITVRRCTVSVGTKTLYVYCCHFTPNSYAGRQTQMQFVLDSVIGTENPDYWVIGADFNTGAQQSSDDPDVATQCAWLRSVAAANNATLANGGYLGWINTNKVNLPLDNFLCGPKVIVRKFEVLGNWFADLWSDHYPIYADLALLD